MESDSKPRLRPHERQIGSPRPNPHIKTYERRLSPLTPDQQRKLGQLSVLDIPPNIVLGEE